MKILVCKHHPREGLGLYETIFAAAGIGIDYQELPQDDRPRVLADYQGLIVMGGAMNAYQEQEYPFLRTDLHYIETALRLQRPLLGICLGAQLSARVLGATIRKNPQRELGWYRLERLAESPLLEGFPASFSLFQWHEDTFEIPGGARHLARSASCPNQAFQWGDRAFGVQFHPEVTAAVLHEWLADAATITGWGFDPETLQKDTAQYQAAGLHYSRMLGENFIQILQRCHAE